MKNLSWRCLIAGAISMTCSTAQAQETKVMRLGRDAIGFHMNICGNRVVITKEPFEDHWWRYMDVLNAVYRPLHKKTGKKFFFPIIREVENFNNACALVHSDGERYVIIDPASWIRDAGILDEMITYGHEAGHHVCGHSVGIRPNERWEVELEADRFSGAALRALYEDTEIADYRSIYETFTLDSVIRAAWTVYSRFSASTTHPPANLRVAAIKEGYLNGSNCVQKAMLDSPAREVGRPGASIRGGNYWDHNGSMMSLASNGVKRQFVYETPRPGLNELGVDRGTIVFSGKREGFRYVGTAFVFSKRCGKSAYAVSGSVSDDQRSVTLHGNAPLRDTNCRISGYRDDTLVFTFQGD